MPITENIQVSDLTAAAPVAADILYFVDVSDTTDDPDGSSRRCLVSDLPFQPVDADLSAIAALTTTTYGRSLLTSADASALRTAAGLGTLATQSGTFSGTSSGTNTGDQFGATSAGTLIGRRSGSAGAAEEITVGSGLTLSGTTLTAAGGSPGGSSGQVQFNSSGSFAGDADLTFDGATLSVAKVTVGYASWPTWYLRCAPSADIAFDVVNEFGSYLFQSRRTAFGSFASYSTPNGFFVVPGIVITQTGGGSGAPDLIIASGTAPGVGQTTGQIKMPAMDSGGQHRETVRIVAVVTDESFGAGNAKADLELYAGRNTLAATFDGSGVDTRIKLKSGSSDPTTSDVPSGYAVIWKTTTGGAVKLWCNDGGVMKSVALT